MKKWLIYISFISLLILFWSGTANAKIILEAIIASPDPATVNNDVKITFRAHDDSFLSILFITPLISPPTGKKITYPAEFCSKDKQPVQNCLVELVFKPDKIGKYTIEANTVLSEEANKSYKPRPDELSFTKYTLNVNETGALPTPPATAETPIIQKITVNGVDTMLADINSQIEIYGPEGVTKKEFCSVGGDINLSQIKVIFSQPSSSPKTTGWLPGSTCDVLKVLVSEDLKLTSSENGERAEVRVQNTAGISEAKVLFIRPAIAAPWERTSTSPLPGQKPEWELQVNWPKNPLGVSLQGDSLTNLVEYLYGWGISLGGFAAFVVLIMAGIQYLTSAGDAGKMKDAMDKIRNAVIGLVMLFASVLILNTINPQLTQLKMPSLGETFTKQCADCMGQNGNDWEKKCTDKCGLTAEDERTINFTLKCDSGAYIYASSDCQGSEQAIQIGAGKDITCEKQGTCSMKAEKKNMCSAEFYNKIGCMGDPIAGTLIGSGCVNIESLRFEETIRCIKIKKP